jgi:pimeloyl-ACP methyl ester carboxylesterase
MPRARINGVDLFYQDTGGDGPALLLIAGLGATGHIWGPLPRRLSRGMRVITYDHRWLGRSGGPCGSAAFSELVGDARGLLDHLGVRRAHILGKSLGGMIAQRIALDQPDRVDRLVLVASTAQITPYLFRIGEFFHTLSRNLSAAEYLHTVFTFCFSPQYHDKNHEDTVRTEETLAKALGDVRAIAQHVESFRGLDFRSELAQLRIPTLVIGGTQDHLIPPAQHRELADAIPGAELLTLEGVGHSPIAETGHPLIARIVDFLGAPQLETAISFPH